MTICSDCAQRLGFTPKKKVVGIWMDECDYCHEHKPVCDAFHDYYQPKKEETK